ncbi:hypothetical protein Lalb_Chr14g0376111 [Lupinus albus]|uniref:Uncharacterized protein n=1 Tax=Lupinus albus TaxID=3870 RepID=A0A6A4PGU1_LUPAL|nr:hypothetical protein Lalb_Chr14g0376111 [Lupinus albus]
MARKSNHKNITTTPCSNSNATLSPTNVKKKKRARKSIPRDPPSQRSSIYRGVTRLLYFPSFFS